MLFLRSILSAVLEYGYYNSRGNAFETETRVVFIDSGFSHTSFAVVKSTIGDNVDEVIESRKVYLRALDAFEKHLVTLNAPSACACYV